MAKDLESLRNDALRIQNETAHKANSATRVGSLLVDIIDALSEGSGDNITVKKLTVTEEIHFKPNGGNDTFAVTSSGVEARGYKVNGADNTSVILAGGGVASWSGGGGGGGDDPDPGTGSTVYYGFASNSNISSVSGLQSENNKTSAAGYYNSTNSDWGYWWFVIPASWNLTTIKSSGIGVLYEQIGTITVGSTSYKKYRTSNELSANPWQFEVI